jgi:hypothetical protein
MERSKLFLAVAATLAAACETPTAPSARRLDADRPALDASSTSATTFSGEATVLQAKVGGMPITLVGTGPLDQSGGAQEKTLAQLEISEDQTPGRLLALRARVGHASTVGQGKKSRSEATVADLALRVLGIPIEARFLEAAASAVCDAAGNAVGAASSAIAGLTVNGQSYAVTSEYTVIGPVGGVTIVLNEQHVDQSGNHADATVTALRITAQDPLLGEVEVIVARAHADITCRGCTDQGDDFHTGGGWFRDGADQFRHHFAVAGGYKNGGPWGHLTYKSEDYQLNGGEVESYTPDPMDPSQALITGRGRLRNGSTAWFKVTVDDNGEPGRADTFTIELFEAEGMPAFHTAGGTLAGGNIQFHDKPSRCPVN